uniref:G-protein coupled receptors family 1 profile domain-containing protein n=1 Tax=Plectus sambesii TaxID=2011161 RepID=A0A914VX01_9BILA
MSNSSSYATELSGGDKAIATDTDGSFAHGDGSFANGEWWLSGGNESGQSNEDMGGMPDVPIIILHMSLTMGLAIGGNLLLIFVIIRSNTACRRRITPVQMLILHTCTADLLFALITIMPTMINTATFPHFHGPNWLCKAVRYGQMIPMYASPFLLVAISADRYQAICRPLASLKSGRYRRPAIFACIAWLLAFLLSIPQLFIFEIMHGDCLANYANTKQHQAYAIGFTTTAWLLPSIFAASFYFCVCRAVWYSSLSQDSERLVKQSSIGKKRSDSAAGREGRNSLMIPSVNGDPTSNSTAYVNKLRTSFAYRKQTNENERKRVQTVKLTLTIVACNFLLWSPFCITNVVYALFPDFLSTQLTTYVMILGNVNSCVNPWIYVLFNRVQVRRACCTGRGGRDDCRSSSRMDGRSLTVLSTGSRRNLSATNSNYSVSMTTHLLPNDMRTDRPPLRRNSSQSSRRSPPREWRRGRQERESFAQRYMRIDHLASVTDERRARKSSSSRKKCAYLDLAAAEQTIREATDWIVANGSIAARGVEGVLAAIAVVAIRLIEDVIIVQSNIMTVSVICHLVHNRSVVENLSVQLYNRERCYSF